MATVLLEARSYRPFKSSEEYLYAMREDLAEWMNTMYPELRINVDNFMDRLDTGVALCKHANYVRTAAEEYLARRQARNKSMTKSMTSGLAGPILAMGNVHFLPAAKSGTFFARDNVSNFISWCRKSLQIFECLLFETDDLIMRKNEKHVILCLLEVARRGAKFGMLAPMLVQMERQIDREIAADNKANGVAFGTQTEDDAKQTTSTSTDTENGLFDTDSDDEDTEEPMLMYGPQPQIITNDLKSLDEMVRDLVEKCTCPSQFPMVRVSEGKYRIGDTKVLIFVRILRSHVMVRVGGGWDTLSHYLDKHDPCRCRAQHRSSVAARIITRTNQATNGIELHKAQVFFERSPPSARKSLNNSNSGATSRVTSPTTANTSSLSPQSGQAARNRSRSPTPHASQKNNSPSTTEQLQSTDKNLLASPNLQRRSMSPSPRRLGDLKSKKQTSFDLNVGTATTAPPAATTETDTSKLNETNGTANGTTDNGGKFENISDNGSEISDEGYRSLGLIQQANNNQSKRTSLHSQTSIEDVKTDDAKTNVRLDQTSSDSQCSPTDELSSKGTAADLIETIESSPVDTPDATLNTEVDAKPFEEAGVFITDDDITVDVSNTTGLRKTGYSDDLYSDSLMKKTFSKIPRSPMPRRKSIDSCSVNSDNASNSTGLPILSRKMPVYRSVRKSSSPNIEVTTSSQATTSPKKDIGTWNGRAAAGAANKKRPTVGTELFTPISSKNSGSTSNLSQKGTTPFQRNSENRASRCQYDQNGRRIVKSTNTSPVKQSTSPLAQQILEAAESAKNDAHMLEKMKLLLSKYTVNKTGSKSSGSSNRSRSTATPSPVKNKDEFEDFTTAWVNSNGSLDRTSNCCTPVKAHSKRSSAASSCDSTAYGKGDILVSARRDRGISRIPAPIRQNTELY
ncbi:GAS2-like protein pickled eggs [Sitodiplosis mosellana]|uniref:GAS2-like protein pickled eggs n=1 Tax=Sitodiplosis mosellana TaxID=263140 RepID=UPI002443D47C|nr:GAS2-like protein pickled eggs [Sitodiplosis mosellana]XP_055326899.1 GAS2-like protein pickled eggs [Sitodiplosis mosellana]XP_055326900.1 GAS2-like protein pickled eggs [Sitodiplosis mosellana]XP_055326901.1 GAS2-like protein pickled eggs [Sitodiplosis mosellana]XP_055326902.1 GAS2-like protein pickled eggs [Sitodiplosis mosellana]XP_055326903.1 GAS2-like protein pickled eggs [Sitodiplosis mosellana]XP_055326904.1 GAS2-like protein pickled eggs [Sitodiplosis mosellana]XP_055326905.1 GAS